MSAVLRNLTVKFGSLVDEPANKGARIMLFKRDDTTGEVSLSALTDAVAEVEKVGRKMSGARMAALKVAIEHLKQIMSEVECGNATDCADDEEELDMSKKNDAPAAVEAVESVAEPVIEKAAEPVADEAIAKRLADLEKRAADAEARALAAEEVAKVERDERLTREYVAKAAKLDALSQAPETLGGILKRAAEKLSAEDCAELDRILAAANEAVGKSKLFGEIGKSGAEDTAGNAWTKIESLAKAEREANPTLTIEKARVEVMKRHPELRDAYYAEREAAH